MHERTRPRASVEPTNRMWRRVLVACEATRPGLLAVPLDRPPCSALAVPWEGDRTSSVTDYSEIRSLTGTNKPPEFLGAADHRGERDAEGDQRDIVEVPNH